jgi:hypothetical protein
MFIISSGLWKINNKYGEIENFYFSKEYRFLPIFAVKDICNMPVQS